MDCPGDREWIVYGTPWVILTQPDYPTGDKSTPQSRYLAWAGGSINDFYLQHPLQHSQAGGTTQFHFSDPNRLPATTFTYHAAVAFPALELRLTAAEKAAQADNQPLVVADYHWQAPFSLQSNSANSNQTAQLVWRRQGSGDTWQPLGAESRFPLWQLGDNGIYHLEFTARSDTIRYAASTLSLTIRVALDDEGCLHCCLDLLQRRLGN